MNLIFKELRTTMLVWRTYNETVRPCSISKD